MSRRTFYIFLLFTLIAGGILLRTSSAERPGVLVKLDFEELKKENTDVNLQGRVYGGVGRNPLEPFAPDACVPNPQGCFILIAHHFSPDANPPRFLTLGTLRPDFPGSTALAHHRSLGEIVLTRIDGGTFDFIGIDLAELPSLDANGRPILSGRFNITFYGKKRNGRGISATLTLSNISLGLEPFKFENFDDVVSVSWFQGAGGLSFPTHQFDNILVSPQ